VIKVKSRFLLWRVSCGIRGSVQYETVLLIGAGIGVTLFASILKNIQYQLVHADPTSASFGKNSALLSQPLHYEKKKKKTKI
jgi:ferredoxin-NADP reductase